MSPVALAGDLGAAIAAGALADTVTRGNIFLGRITHHPGQGYFFCLAISSKVSYRPGGNVIEARTADRFRDFVFLAAVSCGLSPFLVRSEQGLSDASHQFNSALGLNGHRGKPSSAMTSPFFIAEPVYRTRELKHCALEAPVGRLIRQDRILRRRHPQ
jgi:hypothetical protein